MTASEGKVQVAVLNTSEDIVQMIQVILEHEGIRSVAAYIDDAKRGRVDLAEFLKAHDPSVVVYDIAPPYEENWALCRSLRSTEAARDRVFVITTTNKAVLDRLVGPTGAHEIIGKPFDMDTLVQMVRTGLDGHRRGRAG